MTARLVAVGQKKADYPTLYAQYANGEPAWEPVPSGDVPEIDYDLLDKQDVESRLAWGDDL